MNRRQPFRCALTAVIPLLLCSCGRLSDDMELKAKVHAVRREMMRIAGQNATDCGHVVMHEHKKQANQCALAALHERKSFYVSYEVPGTDAELITGLAGIDGGSLYSVKSVVTVTDFVSVLNTYVKPRVGIVKCPAGEPHVSGGELSTYWWEGYLTCDDNW